MTITYIRSNTFSSVGQTGGDTEASDYLLTATLTAGTSATNSWTISGSATERNKVVTEGISSPNLVTWGGGTYTWFYRVTTANTSHNIIEVILRRLNSAMSTVKASKSSGAISINCTSGVKTGTISWNDGTQNPGSPLASDLFEIVIRVQNVATMSGAHSFGVLTTGSNDETITPIDAGAGPAPVTCTVTSSTITNKIITQI